MASRVLPSPRTRRWTRVEYERLIELGVFQPGERLELLDGLLVVREPQGSRHAAAIRRSDRVDHEHKASRYARAGIADYWIVDLAHEALEVHRDPEASPGTPIPGADLLP
jgi:Uma2 family endonuclease